MYALMQIRPTDLAYRRVHRAFRTLQRSAGIRRLIPPTPAPTAAADYLAQLSLDPRLLPLVEDVEQRGWETVARQLRCPSHVRTLYGGASYSALQRVWDQLEPRYVEVTLVQGRGLPAAQSNTYCVFYLVKPCRAVLAELTAEGAQVQ
jgi:hypothetical protein